LRLLYGSVALKGKAKKGVPRKSPEEYIRIAKKLRDRVDTLLTHDSPKLPLPEHGFMSGDKRVRAVNTVIYEAIPKAVMYEHIHVGKPYTVYRHEYGRRTSE